MYEKIIFNVTAADALTNSHFYLIELKAQKSNEISEWPAINPLHKVAMKKHSNICPIDFSTAYQNT